MVLRGAMDSMTLLVGGINWRQQGSVAFTYRFSRGVPRTKGAVPDFSSMASWTLAASANSKWLAEYWRVARDMVDVGVGVGVEEIVEEIAEEIAE